MQVARLSTMLVLAVFLPVPSDAAICAAYLSGCCVACGLPAYGAMLAVPTLYIGCVVECLAAIPFGLQTAEICRSSSFLASISYATACQDGNSQVLLPDGSTKLVSRVKVGDAVADASIVHPTGKIATASVVANIRTEGIFDFVQITTSLNVFNVTNEHALIVDNDGDFEIKRAADLKVGDAMRGAHGEHIVVRDIKFTQRNDKWTLFTTSGTVVVNGVHMTAFCEDNLRYPSNNYTLVMDVWRNLHMAI